MADSVNETKEKAKEEAALEEHDEGLVDTVQEKLDALLGEPSDDAEDDKDDDQQADDDKVDDDSTPGDDDASDDDDDDDDDDQADSTKDDDDSTPDDDDKKKDETKTGSEEEVTLPDAHYRAAIHQGWSPDQIKDYFEASPETAIKTFAKIHETTNKLSSEFARIGRIKLAPEQKVAPKADDKTADDAAEIAALKEQYGDDSAVVKAFAAMQIKLDAAAVQSEIANKQENADVDPAIRSTIDKFFVDPTLKPYADFYGEGKDAAKLTRGQSDNRHKMLEMADSIALGCQSQGRDITLEEVLESAHLLVSESVREKALRKELTAKVVKRAKGVSLRPAKSKTAPSAKDAKLSEKDFEAKVHANLQKTFR